MSLRVRLTPDEFAGLRAQALATGMSVSQVARIALAGLNASESAPAAQPPAVTRPGTHRNAAGVEFVTVECPVCQFSHAHRTSDEAEARRDSAGLSDVRYWLWSGCIHEGKYGDDGELQCRGQDFRRDPIPALIVHIVQAASAGLNPHLLGLAITHADENAKPDGIDGNWWVRSIIAEYRQLSGSGDTGR